MQRRITLAASVIAATGLLAPQASARAGATTCPSKGVKESYSANWHAVAKLHGKRAPGRNIRRYGMASGRPSGCRQLRRSLVILRRMRMPVRAARYVVTGAPRQPPAATESLTGNATLRAIAQCESGGDPRAVSPGGTYRGLLQFDRATWQSVGGVGDPAAASPAEQYKRGAILYAQRGSAPWPICGR